MIKADSAKNYLYASAQQFDEAFNLEKFDDAEVARLASRIFYADMPDWPEGLREAFSHHRVTFFGQTGAVEWLRNLPRPEMMEHQSFEAEAARILKETQTQTAYSKKESVMRKELSRDLATVVKNDPFLNHIQENNPHAIRLFQELFYHNNLEMNDTSRARMSRFVWQNVTKKAWFRFKFTFLAAKVWSAAGSFFSRNWIRWSVSALNGMICSPLFFMVYPLVGTYALIVCNLFSFAVCGELITTSLTTLALTSPFAGIGVLLAIALGHLALTSAISGADYVLGGSMPLIHHCCLHLQQMGLSFQNSLYALVAACVGILGPLAVAYSTDEWIRNTLLPKIIWQQLRNEIVDLKLTFVYHMSMALNYVYKMMLRDYETAFKEDDKKTEPGDDSNPGLSMVSS